MKNIIFVTAKVITIMALVIAALWCGSPFALYFTDLRASRYLPAFIGLLTLLLAIPAFVQYTRERRIEALFTCHAWLCASMILSSASWAGIPVMELSYPISVALFGSIFVVIAAVLLILYTRNILASFAAAPPSNPLPRLRALLTAPIKPLYLLSAVLVILIVLYIKADVKYVPQLVLKRSPGKEMIPSPPAKTAVSLMTATQGDALETGASSPYSDQAEAVLPEGLILGITNASGALSVDARASLERCCESDGVSRCLTLQKMQSDERRPVYYAGAFEIPAQGNSTVARLEMEEGRLNFSSMKEAFDWIDQDGNRSFHYIYNNSGLLAGWYKTALPQAPGALVRIRIWQLSIDGEKPEMLPGNQNEQLRIAKRAIDSSRIRPAVRRPEQADSPRARKVAIRKQDKSANWQEYCVEDKDEVNGEYISLNTDIEGLAIDFKEHKRDQRAETMGLARLQGRLDRLIREKNAINGQNKLPVKDPAKIHVAFDGEAYHVPDDIAEWVPKRKHLILAQKWFRHNDIEYLYLTTGFDGRAFYSRDGGVDDIMYRTEGLYMFVNNRQGTILEGEKIDILKIENDAVIVGVRNDGYEGSNGKVISFDGNKATVICNWGFGL